MTDPRCSVHTSASEDTNMPDKETVVVKDGGGGNSATVILGVIALILVLAAGWYFLIGPGTGSNSNTNEGPTINVELPSGAPAAS
jgi:hypothetical protein